MGNFLQHRPKPLGAGTFRRLNSRPGNCSNSCGDKNSSTDKFSRAANSCALFSNRSSGSDIGFVLHRWPATTTVYTSNIGPVELIHLLESHATCHKKRLNPIMHITFIVADHGTGRLPAEL